MKWLRTTKSNRFLSALFSIAIALVVVVTSFMQISIHAEASNNYISLFYGDSWSSNWGQAVDIATTRCGGTFDPSNIKPGGHFYVEYSGTEGEVELIMQSMSGGAGWAKISPSEKGYANGHYCAKYSYENCVNAFGSDNFSGLLDKIYVGATSYSINVYSLCYDFGTDIDNNDSGSTDSGNTDSGNSGSTDNGNTESGNSGNTDSGNNDSGNSGNTGSGDIVVTGSDVIYCSPNGNGNGSSMSNPTSVSSAISAVKAGGTIYLLDGTYYFNKTLVIDESNSGSNGAMKKISAYPGATVKWDFSSLSVSDSNRGVVLDGSYWHFYGFEIANAGDNGMLLSGDNNKIEMMVFSGNQDTGLQLSRYKTSYSSISQWPSYNYILNCTSRNNCDDATMENADGFAAKLTCGEGNVFDGCMAYNNSDDGWDLYAKTETGPIGVVTIQNCIAFRNGYTEDGRGYGDCDGNGFKLGGAGVGTAHVVKNCLAFENLNCGFTDNNNPKLASISNCTAVNNGIGNNKKPNFSVYRCDNCDFNNLMSYYNNSSISKGSDKYVGRYENGVYYNGGNYYKVDSDTSVSNGQKIGTKFSGPSDSDFTSTYAPSMGTDFHTTWRKSDGSLNPNGYFETTGSYYSMGYRLSDATGSGSTNSGNTSSGNTENNSGSSASGNVYTDSNGALIGLDGTYYIKSVHSGKYLDVENCSSANGANVQQYSYNGCDAQKFKLVGDGNGYYAILTACSGYQSGLDVYGWSAANGTNIDQWEYHGGDCQKFQIVKIGDAYAIKTKVSSCYSCLDVYNWSTNDGGNIAQYEYWGGNCQLWYLEACN